MRKLLQRIGEFFNGPAAVGMQTQPIVVNPDTGARATQAFYRLDAIKRTVEQKLEEGRAIAPERMAEYRTEVRAQLAFLLSVKAITEERYGVMRLEILPGENV